jgi:hypothetical protein
MLDYVRRDNMVKVKIGAVVKNVPDPTWYLIAGWKIVEEKIKKEVKVDKTDTEKTTS